MERLVEIAEDYARGLQEVAGSLTHPADQEIAEALRDQAIATLAMARKAREAAALRGPV